MAHILIMAASTGKNLDLASSFHHTVLSQGNTAEILDLCRLDLPMYTPETEKKHSDLSLVHNVMEQILASDALIVCAPEYNGSMPPVLNNLVAWLSVQSKDFRMLFNRRKIGLASVSGGGGQHVIMNMRMQFSFLGANVLGRSVVINKTKQQNQLSLDTMAMEVLN
jgi:chromate reductase, NAD(P)H dehydrogenase (quinone)